MLKHLKVYYIFVTLPFVMLLTGAAVFFDAIRGTISRNPHPQINYVIFVIILVGGVLVIFNARRLMREARILAWFSLAMRDGGDPEYMREKTNACSGALAGLLQMVAASMGRGISHQEQVALEHELANVRSRLNRRNVLPQYLTGLLVGMGLLGTFIGLLATLNDIATLISSFGGLDMATVDPIQVFQTMIERMKAPMRGMSIAFSASMFGLLGSIVIGLMMVGIRRFQNDIFSLLSSEVARHVEMALARAGSGSGPGGDFGAAVTNVLLRIEERMAAEIESFKGQWAAMLATLSGQAATAGELRDRLDLIGDRLGDVIAGAEKNSSDNAALISELVGGVEARLREVNADLVRGIDEHGERLAAIGGDIRQGTDTISARIAELGSDIRGGGRQAEVLANKVSNAVCGELGQVCGRIDSMLGLAVSAGEKGRRSLAEELTGLRGDLETMARDDDEGRELTRALVAELGRTRNAVEKGSDGIISRLDELGAEIGENTREVCRTVSAVGAEKSRFMRVRS